MSSIFLGACLAAADGTLHPGWLFVTIASFFAVEVAKNASGDIYDFQTDSTVKQQDRTDFSGGKRVLVDGLLSVRQTWVIAILFYGLGMIGGICIVFFREPQAVWIGLIGLALAWSYNGPPAKLAYRGLGELDVAVCYGPLICISTYLIQLGSAPLHVLIASIPLGILIGAFLWINEFPDYAADRSVNKRNLVVRLGRKQASRVLPVILIVAFVIIMLLPQLGLAAGSRLGLIAVIPASFLVVFVWRDPEHCYRSRPVSPLALLTFISMSLGTGIGVML
jgi:1,4-dihydroxy-2-naphthoate octaprenyltransferase